MTKTIVALFDDITVARQVVEDLVNAGFARSSISLVTNDAHNQYSQYLDKDYVPREDAVTATEGAGFGAVVGALTGLLAGLAALMIPGVGLLIVAGPIAAALTGAVAGALTGGVAGALIKSGVPEDKAPYYAEGIRRGATLISLETSDTLRAEDIMNRHGSVNIHERIDLWRQTGWKGFGDETIESIAVPSATAEVTSTMTPDKRITQATPITQDVRPTSSSIVFEESQIDDDDTAKSKSLPVMVTAPATDTEIPVTVIPTPMTPAPLVLPIEEEAHAEPKNASSEATNTRYRD